MTAQTQKDSGPSPPGSLPWSPPEHSSMGLMTEVCSQQMCRASKAVSFQEYRGTWREVWVGRLKEVIDGSGKVNKQWKATNNTFSPLRIWKFWQAYTLVNDDKNKLQENKSYFKIKKLQNIVNS